jgi:hypothetical protein
VSEVAAKAQASKGLEVVAVTAQVPAAKEGAVGVAPERMVVGVWVVAARVVEPLVVQRVAAGWEVERGQHMTRRRGLQRYQS